MPPRLQHLEGKRFSKLVALERAGFRLDAKGRKTLWRCQCDCGKEIVTAQQYLVAGGTKSCGCIVGKHKRTHGMTGTPEYRTWDAMRRRCNDPKNTNYPHYGGRGIKVCERWERFENFYADMGPRPSPLHSIDRIENDRHYEPGNCRWATDVVQSNNRRSSLVIEFCDEQRTAAQWEKIFGHKPGLISRRLLMGWTVERALTQPSARLQTRDREGSGTAREGLACS